MPESQFTKESTHIQIIWAIQLFSRFIQFTEKRTQIQPSLFLQKLKQLDSNAVDTESTVKELNEIIGEFNQKLNAASKNKGKYLPFPEFSLVVSGYELSAVLDQLDMVERTLTEAAEAGIIDWKDEGGYFSEILKIFSEVELKKIRPHEGMARLILKLEKINQTLPTDMTFPLPDLSIYE